MSKCEGKIHKYKHARAIGHNATKWYQGKRQIIKQPTLPPSAPWIRPPLTDDFPLELDTLSPLFRKPKKGSDANPVERPRYESMPPRQTAKEHENKLSKKKREKKALHQAWLPGKFLVSYMIRL